MSLPKFFFKRTVLIQLIIEVTCSLGCIIYSCRFCLSLNHSRPFSDVSQAADCTVIDSSLTTVLGLNTMDDVNDGGFDL